MLAKNSSGLLNVHRWALASALDLLMQENDPSGYSREQVSFLVADLLPIQVEFGNLEALVVKIADRFRVSAKILETPPIDGTSAVTFLDEVGWCLIKKMPKSNSYLVQSGHRKTYILLPGRSYRFVKVQKTTND